MARWMTIFGVHRVHVYYDRDPYFDSHGLGRYIVKVLRYAVVPPHLKKAAFPLERTNRAFGVVPPKNIPQPHWAAIVQQQKNRALLHNGKTIILREPHGTAVMYKGNRQMLPEEAPQYEGYYAHFWPSLKKLMATLKQKGYTIVGASKEGTPKPIHPKRTLLVLGSPFRDIFEIEKEGYDYVFAIPPFYPNKSLRMDEALVLSLAALR